jgi:O-antigen ligase
MGRSQMQQTTFFTQSRILILATGSVLAALTFSIAAAIIPQDYLFYVVFAVLGGVAGLFLLVRPEWALIITIAYIPFESNQFRPIPLPDQLSVVKILGLVLLGSFFFNILFRRRPFRLLDDLHDYSVLLLLVMLLFSGLASTMPGEVIDTVFRLIRMFAFYFAVKNLITTPRIMHYSLWAIALTSTYASAFGLNQFFEIRAVRIHDVRASGVYMNPNDFAAVAVLVLIVLVYLFQIHRQTWIRVALILMAAINLYALVLSASRGGILALTVVALLFILRHPQRFRLLAGAALLVVLIVPLLPQSVTDRFIERENNGSSSIYKESADFSAERRTRYLEFGLRLFAENPVLGVGPGTFPFLFAHTPEAAYLNPMTDHDRFRVAHNAYLEMAIGMGLPGIMIYLGILAIAWQSLYRSARRLPPGSVAWAAASAFELGLIGIMITNIFLSNQDSKYMWMMVGLSSALTVYTHQTLSQMQAKVKAA